jgi:mannose-6-phosphate isomerase-like protein (cupin superfamily)
VSGFTLANLREVEDSAVAFGFSPALEARFARGALETAEVGISYQRLAPGARMPFGHRHGQQEEVYVVLGGGGKAAVDDEIVEVRPLDALRVAPEAARSFEAGPEGLELLAFGGGSGGVQDAEIIPGWWPGNVDE